MEKENVRSKYLETPPSVESVQTNRVDEKPYSTDLPQESKAVYISPGVLATHQKSSEVELPYHP